MAENQKGFTMQGEIKKAVCFGDRTAGRNLRNISYQETPKMSNLKESIGDLLLYLQTPLGRNEKQNGFNLIEILLFQYIEIKYSGDSK